MSSRRGLLSGAHRNRGRPSAASASARQNHGPAELPEYESPSCPLDATSRRALAELSTNQDSRKYEEQLGQSLKLLTDSVRDINDKYVKRKQNLKNHQERRGQGEEKSERERAEEKAVLTLKAEVPQLTDECESGVRDVVDLKVQLVDGRAALQETVRQVEAESANAEQRQADQNNEDEDDDMAYASQLDVTGPLRILEETKGRASADYSSKSQYERYGLNNDYVHFKRMWHDAVHGADGKPLPDASRWFAQNGNDGEGDDDDEDLVIAEEHLDIHCPLSMAVMQDPYTSHVCKHTFDKTSIVAFLRTTGDGRAQCPQTGCNKILSMADLYPDQVMLRRIKRAQASEVKPDVDDDDEDEDADGDESMQMTQQRNIKSERGRDRGRRLIEDIEDGDEE